MTKVQEYCMQLWWYQHVANEPFFFKKKKFSKSCANNPCLKWMDKCFRSCCKPKHHRSCSNPKNLLITCLSLWSCSNFHYVKEKSTKMAIVQWYNHPNFEVTNIYPQTTDPKWAKNISVQASILWNKSHLKSSWSGRITN